MLITGVGNASLLSKLSLCFCVFLAQYQLPTIADKGPECQYVVQGHSVGIWVTRVSWYRDTVLVFGLPGSRGTRADIPAPSEDKHEVKIMSVG